MRCWERYGCWSRGSVWRHCKDASETEAAKKCSQKQKKAGEHNEGPVFEALGHRFPRVIHPNTRDYAENHKEYNEDSVLYIRIGLFLETIMQQKNEKKCEAS